MSSDLGFVLRVVVLAFAAVACEASPGNSQTPPDGAAEGDADISALADTAADAQDALPPTPPTLASFAGMWNGEYVGAAQGHFEVEISATGLISGTVQLSDGSTLQAATQLQDNGDGTFSIAGHLGLPEYDVSYDGRFRGEGDHRFGWGTWQSTSGYSGQWGTWRDGVALSPDPQELLAGCANAMAQCDFGTDGGPATPEECVTASGCVASFMAAHSDACLTVFGQLAQTMFTATRPADCPDLGPEGTPPAGWTEAQCPEMPNCAPPKN